MQDNMIVLEDLIRRCQISMQMQKVQSNPIIGVDLDAEGIDHYRCKLFKPGKEIDVYLSINPTDGAVTVSDVLFMLAMDASGCKLLEGFDEYKDELGLVFGGSDGNLEEIDEFWREYNGRCRQSAELEDFLGHSTYEEMMHHFDIGSVLA